MSKLEDALKIVLKEIMGDLRFRELELDHSKTTVVNITKQFRDLEQDLLMSKREVERLDKKIELLEGELNEKNNSKS